MTLHVMKDGQLVPKEKPNDGLTFIPLEISQKDRAYLEMRNDCLRQMLGWRTKGVTGA